MKTPKQPRSPIGPKLELPLEEWPERDRAAWEANLRVDDDDLDAPAYPATVRPSTIKGAQKAWGRFLAVLRDADRLDVAAGPADRATRSNMAVFVQGLRAAGNTGPTIAVRLFNVRSALKVIVPGRDKDYAWIVRPNGVCAWLAFPDERRTFVTHNPRALLEFGVGLMNEAIEDLPKLTALQHYRNGLLFALWAVTGLRQRTMSLLNLGTSIRRTGDGSDVEWRLDIPPEDMKTNCPLSFPIYAGLNPCLDLYLDVVRPAFGTTTNDGPFWVQEGGEGLGYRAFDGIVARYSPQVDGERFGTHTFRRSIGTFGPIANPADPAATAAMLGISDAVLQEHYNRGNMAEAARRYQKTLNDERSDRLLRSHSQLQNIIAKSY